jgi:hypothetical protein
MITPTPTPIMNHDFGFIECCVFISKYEGDVSVNSYSRDDVAKQATTTGVVAIKEHEKRRRQSAKLVHDIWNKQLTELVVGTLVCCPPFDDVVKSRENGKKAFQNFIDSIYVGVLDAFNAGWKYYNSRTKKGLIDQENDWVMKDKSGKTTGYSKTVNIYDPEHIKKVTKIIKDNLDFINKEKEKIKCPITF